MGRFFDIYVVILLTILGAYLVRFYGAVDLGREIECLIFQFIVATWAGVWLLLPMTLYWVSQGLADNESSE